MNTEEFEILFQLVKEKYGDRLTTEELNEVKNGVEKVAEIAEALRRVKLGNWDEPFSIFKPYKEER
jgi:hypothetical protein